MEKICPLCNGMRFVEEKCPHCGEQMVDGGCVSDYLGPYSPYMDEESLPFHSENCCVHLLYCPACEFDSRLALSFMTM